MLYLINKSTPILRLPLIIKIKYKKTIALYNMPLERKTRLSQEDKDFLIQYFETNSKPSANERADLSLKLNVCDDKIKNWFQNRRAKERCDGGYISKKEIRSDKIYPHCNSLYIRRDIF
jgi:hypothetical protein